ncbi:nucleoside diphosphate kinase regulator [Marinimicrobium sp. ARAG 43.8]|uniref:nucleoside diphosphate kinase regulator n=1 Tax=Marinimicrobium sp. ARAG 43.8 TaxID=3418719 RepID=UPI003CEFDC61
MAKKPAIQMSKADHSALLRLIDSVPEDLITEQLAEELDRAKVVPAHKLPGDTVAIGSSVTFTVQSTGKTFTYQLVYPTELDNTENKLSVLSPVGSAIIGLREGQSIDWTISQGNQTIITVNDVSPPASD